MARDCVMFAIFPEVASTRSSTFFGAEPSKEDDLCIGLQVLNTFGCPRLRGREHSSRCIDLERHEKSGALYAIGNDTHPSESVPLTTIRFRHCNDSCRDLGNLARNIESAVQRSVSWGSPRISIRHSEFNEFVAFSRPCKIFSSIMKCSL